MLRIATWNVNGLRARLDFILLWLRERSPTILGMQELKVADEEFPFDAFREAGYEVLVHGQKGWNGVAIAAKAPIEAAQRGLPGQAEQGARLVAADVAGLRFATAYCPNGKTIDHPDFPRKLAWFESLREELASTVGDAFVLGGDFNVVPAALDCWRGEAADGTIFCTDAERSRYRALLETGLVDLYRRLHPTEQRFSWWDYRGGAFHRGLGLRIDMLLASEAVARRTKAVVIDREFRRKQAGLTASDHAPVYADIDWP